MTTIAVPVAEHGDDDQAAAPTIPGIFTFQVCERCGTFLAPAVTHCPVCTGQCGGPCCTGGTR